MHLKVSILSAMLGLATLISFGMLSRATGQDANKDTKDFTSPAVQDRGQGGPGGGPGGRNGPGGPGGRFGRGAQPGQILATGVQDMLQLTAEQKKDLDTLQKEVDAKLAKILTDDQKKQLKEMTESRPGGGRGPGSAGGPGGPGGNPPGR